MALFAAFGAALGLGSGAAHAGAYEDFFRNVELDNARGVRSLLERGFDPNTRSEAGQVPLYLALRAPSPRVFAVLLDHPETKVDAENDDDETPLMMAALKGDAASARKLVERGAQLNREGWSPLHYAASGPDAELIVWLIDKGAVVDAPSPNDSTPLMMAAGYGSDASVDVLLARGADPKRRNQKGLNAADFARRGGRDKLARRLDAAAAR